MTDTHNQRIYFRDYAGSHFNCPCYLESRMESGEPVKYSDSTGIKIKTAIILGYHPDCPVHAEMARIQKEKRKQGDPEFIYDKEVEIQK